LASISVGASHVVAKNSIPVLLGTRPGSSHHCDGHHQANRASNCSSKHHSRGGLYPNVAFIGGQPNWFMGASAVNQTLIVGGDSETRTPETTGEERLGKASWPPQQAGENASPAVSAISAGSYRRAVNRKNREFVVGLSASPNRIRTRNLSVNRQIGGRPSSLTATGLGIAPEAEKARHGSAGRASK